MMLGQSGTLLEVLAASPKQAMAEAIGSCRAGEEEELRR